MSKKVSISIEIGEEARDYRIGDYLNAIDEITCYFHEKTEHDGKEFAAALRLYADQIGD